MILIRFDFDSILAGFGLDLAWIWLGFDSIWLDLALIWILKRRLGS